tara:strand:+ start:71 stop:769 length:699 start_codon:yes stop_codon:yes gene_type:complete
MFVHITKKSSNAKTGKMPVTTTESSSCPSTCPHIDGNCYAKSGFHLRQHWSKVSSHERGGSWSDLCDFVRSLKPNQLWRHNQAGDLPYVTKVYPITEELIALPLLRDLVDANKSSGAKGYTYTHHILNTHNSEAIKYANKNGFTVNASCESLTQCDDAIKQGIPSVCVVDNSKPVPARTPAGHRVVVCPAQTRDTNCKDCGLCAQSKRTCVVAFLAHGNRAKKLNQTLEAIA